MKISQGKHDCWHFSFEGEIMFQNVPNLRFGII